MCVLIPCGIQGVFTFLDKRTDTGVSILSNFFSAAKSTVASIPASVLYPDYLNQLYQRSDTDGHAVYVVLALGFLVWMLLFVVYLHEYINIKGWCVDGTNESNPSNVVIGLNDHYRDYGALKTVLIKEIGDYLFFCSIK